MVGAEGFELSTSCSQGRRANQAALRPDTMKKTARFLLQNRACISGSPGRTRTADKVVNSHLLYLLSYRGLESFTEPQCVSSSKSCSARMYTDGWGVSTFFSASYSTFLHSTGNAHNYSKISQFLQGLFNNVMPYKASDQSATDYWPAAPGMAPCIPFIISSICFIISAWSSAGTYCIRSDWPISAIGNGLLAASGSFSQAIACCAI